MKVHCPAALNIALPDDRYKAARFLRDLCKEMAAPHFVIFDAAVPLFLLVFFPLFELWDTRRAVGDLYSGGCFAYIVAISFLTWHHLEQLRNTCLLAINQNRIRLHNLWSPMFLGVVALALCFINFLVVYRMKIAHPGWLDHYAAPALCVLFFLSVCAVCTLVLVRVRFRHHLAACAVELSPEPAPPP